MLNKKIYFLVLCYMVTSHVLFAFEHPGGMHPKAQIEYVRQQIEQKNEPYYSAFRQLLKMTDAAIVQEHHATADFSIPGYYVKPDEHITNSLGLASDAFSAYACALAWQLTRETSYGDRVLYFINAWSKINKRYSDSDGPLVMSYTGTAMVIAAELMCDYPDWKNEDKQLFTVWLKEVYRKATNEIRIRKNNWGDWGRFGSMLSAYYLNDTDEIHENIRLFKSDTFDKIAEDGHMPEEIRRGANGLWYTYFSLAPLTATAWLVHNTTGENLFILQKDGRSLKKAVDYLLYYKNLKDGICINLYTASSAKTSLPDGTSVDLKQVTDYPNSGRVEITVSPSQSSLFPLFLRIPAWAKGATVTINGVVQNTSAIPRSFISINRIWEKDDKVILDIPMNWRLVKGRKRQAGRVAIMRGPVLFCLNPMNNRGQGLDQLTPNELGRILLDPSSLKGPFSDKTVRPDGMSCEIGAWREGWGMSDGVCDLQSSLIREANPLISISRTLVSQ